MIKQIALTALAGTIAVSAAPRNAGTYKDESRAPLGQAAHERVKIMEGQKYKHPRFRIPPAEYRARWQQLRNKPVPKWLKDGKFGIYTHWGLYSIPANKDCSNTYVRYMYKSDLVSEKRKRGYKPTVAKFHKKRYGDPAEFGYSDFTKQFKCENFNGEEYVKIMKDAGARFGGLCVVHHDGFLMWDSDVVPWNVGKMGPKRDIYGEFVKAAKKANFKTIATFHHARTFHYASSYLTPEDFTEEEKKKLDIFNPKYDTWFFPKWGKADSKVFNELWLKKVCEVIDKYEPDSLWFDGLSPRAHCTEESQINLMNHYYETARKKGKEVAIFNKLPGSGTFNFPQGVGVKCYEGGRDMPPFSTGPFLVDKAISYPWCYVENKHYKFTPDYHVDAIIDMTARGGYYFMSLTPMASGEIPPREKEICAEIGKWMRINGDAIYGTRMWKIPTEGPLNTFMYKPEKGVIYWDYRIPNKQGEIRFTKKGDYVYAIFLDWSDKEFKIRSLSENMIPNAAIESIELLGHDGKLEYTRDAEALTIKSPAEKPCDYAYAFKIKIKGDVGNNMISNDPHTMPEEGMSYDEISKKHLK